MAERNRLLGDHWAYFGDGNAAQILDSREYIKSKTGEKYIRFIFFPSKRIEQTYAITDQQDPSSGAIVKEYSATEVVFLERGVYRTRVWIFTDFTGGETVVSRRYRELTETLSDTERLLRSAEAAKNRAYQELRIEREQQMLSITQKANMVKEVAKARGRIEGEVGNDMMMDSGGGLPSDM